MLFGKCRGINGITTRFELEVQQLSITAVSIPLGKGNTTGSKHLPNSQLGECNANSCFIFNPAFLSFIFSRAQNQTVVGTRLVGCFENPTLFLLFSIFWISFTQDLDNDLKWKNKIQLLILSL